MTCLPAGFPVVVDAGLPEPAFYAGTELRKYLQKMDGAEHPDHANPGAFVLWLKATDDLEADAFRVTGTEAGITLEASSGSGFVYGAYDFLETQGCRFLAIDCEVVPRKALSQVPGTTEKHPAFRARELFWREAMDGDFAVKLKLNSARSAIRPEQGGKMPFYNFSHSFNQLVPVEKYFDTHPEYFSMIDGQRVRERTQLCLSNPEVRRLCVQGVREWIREAPDKKIFSVSMNDWYRNCQCPQCRAIDEEEESGAGSVIRFVNAVAEEIAEDYPDVMIHTFAYLYCRKPPKITKPNQNVIVRLCSIECCFAHPMARCGCQTGGIDVQGGYSAALKGKKTDPNSFVEDLMGWSRICDHLFIWDYTTNYANYLQPFPNFNALQENLRTFRKYGVEGVFEQGNFSHDRCSALGQLKIFLLSKLMWDPEEDVQRLIREFVSCYYGKAAQTMREYVEIWKRMDEDSHASIYDAPDAGYLTEEKLARAEACLNRALKQTEGIEHERVEREALSLRYARLAREKPDAEGHEARVDAFAADAKRLGITELFERRDLEASFECLKHCHLTRDRSHVPAISYPI